MKPASHAAPRGFIALITAVVISTILLGLATTIGTNTLFARFDALNSEYKRVSVGLAESCINAALTRLSQDYNYSVLTDPLYSVARGGAVIQVGSNDCVIKPMTYTGPVNNKRTYTITTQGTFRGAYTNLSVTAVSQDPSAAPVTPPPLCTLIASPTSIPSGHSTTLLWSNSSNAVTFTIDHGIGAATPLAGGSVSITPVGVGPVTYTGTTGNTGGTNSCAATITVTPPPPAPSCADSVMIFDRTGSMSNTDLSNERSAGNSLIDLYAGVGGATPPLVGVGSFGAYPNNSSLPAGAAAVPVSGQLSTAYATVKSTLTSITGSNSSVGSNLYAAINVGATELNSARHTSGKQKVLVFVSDGLPNEPGTVTNDTGFLSPTANTQNASGELWSNPTGAYADGTLDASDPVSDSDRHRYYNFNFPTIPSGSSIQGIEAVVDAWATAGTVQAPASAQGSPLGTVSPSQWSGPLNANASDDVYATDAVNGHQQGYRNFNFAIPANATITGIEVETEAQVAAGAPQTTATLTPNGQGSDTGWSGNESDVAESGTPDCSSNDRLSSSSNGSRESVNINLSSVPNGSIVTSVQVFTWDQSGTSGGVYKTYVRVDGGTRTDASGNLTTTSTSGCTARNQVIDIPNFVKSNSTDLEVGVLKVGNSPEARIGTLRAVVTYTAVNTGSISVALSSNNGGSWGTAKTATISSVESVVTPAGNGPTDLWGRAWVPNDFANGNFALRIQNTTGSGTQVSLDNVVVTVSYTIPSPGSSACTFSMDLSWNGGSSWTSEKSQTLSDTEATYTLGSQSDDWSGHTWALTDFTNSNFRARIHATDPGSSCDSAAIEHLDWLRLRVTYSQPANSTALATLAADAAKTPGGSDGLPVTIFAIHYGDSSGQSLMTSLATQSISTATVVTAKRAGSTVTVTTSAAHGFIKGNQVTMSGVSSGTLNGTFVITSAATPSTFTYTTSSSGTINATGGTARVNKNFFVSPSSADMQAIFQAIGAAVCPAAAAQCANTVDDDSDGLVDATDPGCHTDGDAANAATYDATDNDEWEAVPTPPVPPPPPPPPSVQLGSWTEVPTLP